MFIFYKSRCGECSLEIKVFIKYSRYNKERSCLSHQAVQTFYRKIKCDLLDLRGVPNE